MDMEPQLRDSAELLTSGPGFNTPFCHVVSQGQISDLLKGWDNLNDLQTSMTWGSCNGMLVATKWAHTPIL